MVSVSGLVGNVAAGADAWVSNGVAAGGVTVTATELATGAVTQILQEDKRYGGYGTEPTISPDGASVAYAAEDALHPTDLFVAGGAEMRSRRASEVAPALSERGFGRAQVVEWRTIDGAVAHGALVYPAGYEPGKTYPLIVKVYGGSEISNDLNRFGFAVAPFENLQIFATRGYAILVGPPPVQEAGLGGESMDWPLDVAMGEFGVEVAEGYRCGTVYGEDAATLAPALGAANQLTQWTQDPTTSATFGLTVRSIAIDEDPCAEVFGAGS